MPGIPVPEAVESRRGIAEFFYENPTTAPHVLRKSSFRKMMKAVQEAPMGYVPPKPSYVLDERLSERRAEIQKEVLCPHSLAP